MTDEQILLVAEALLEHSYLNGADLEDKEVEISTVQLPNGHTKLIFSYVNEVEKHINYPHYPDEYIPQRISTYLILSGKENVRKFTKDFFDILEQIERLQIRELIS